MKIRTSWILFAVSLLLGTGIVQAQAPGGEDDEDLSEIVMGLLPENAATPEAMTKQLELPEPVALESPARANSAAGRNKERMVEGLTNAQEARDRVEEFGQSMADEATRNRENFSHGNPPGRPDGLPPGSPGGP